MEKGGSRDRAQRTGKGKEDGRQRKKDRRQVAGDVRQWADELRQEIWERGQKKRRKIQETK